MAECCGVIVLYLVVVVVVIGLNLISISKSVTNNLLLALICVSYVCLDWFLMENFFLLLSTYRRAWRACWALWYSF